MITKNDIRGISALIPLGGFIEDVIIDGIKDYYSESLVEALRNCVKKNYNNNANLYVIFQTLLDEMEEGLNIVEEYDDFHDAAGEVDVVKNGSFVTWYMETLADLLCSKYAKKTAGENTENEKKIKERVAKVLDQTNLVERQVIGRYVFDTANTEGSEFEEHIIKELRKRFNGKYGNLTFQSVCKVYKNNRQNIVEFHLCT